MCHASDAHIKLNILASAQQLQQQRKKAKRKSKSRLPRRLFFPRAHVLLLRQIEKFRIPRAQRSLPIFLHFLTSASEARARLASCLLSCRAAYNVVIQSKTLESTQHVNRRRSLQMEGRGRSVQYGKLKKLVRCVPFRTMNTAPHRFLDLMRELLDKALYAYQPSNCSKIHLNRLL